MFVSFLRRIVFVSLLVNSATTFAAVPVIFDSDIGSDIDDTWALSLILKSPEFDLKLVTTASEDTTYRAKVAAKFLTIAKRTDVPVGIGIGSSGNAPFQKPWVADYELNDYPGIIAKDGVGKLIEIVRASPEPVTLIVAGPMHNIQEALQRAPDIAQKIHLVGMHGSIDKGYVQEPSAEYNVANNVPAFQAALDAPWLSFTITPLDTCGDIIIGGEMFKQLKASQDPQLKTIFENFAIWAGLVTWEKADYIDSRTSLLYDAVAVYLALPQHDLISTETLSIAVNEQGFTFRSSEGRQMQAALKWKDKAAFYQWLGERLLSSRQ